MCGLNFVTRFDGHSAVKKLRKIYYKQKARGSDGFGYIAVDGGKVSEVRRSTTEKGILEMLEQEKSSTILFHHRTPTSTPNIVESTHPIEVKNKKLDFDYYVVHNGIITNDEDLKDEHAERGFIYNTEIETFIRTRLGDYSTGIKWNDSEALAIEVALAIEKKKDQIETRGSVAFIAFQVDKKSQKLLAVYYGRNYSNPLRFQREKDFFTLSSEGGSEEVKTETLYRFDFDTKHIEEKPMTIGLYSVAKSYTGEHYANMGYYKTCSDDYSLDSNEEWKEQMRARWLASGGHDTSKEIQLAPDKKTIEPDEIDEVIATLEDELYDLEQEKYEIDQKLVKTIEMDNREIEIEYRQYQIEKEIEDYEIMRENANAS